MCLPVHADAPHLNLLLARSKTWLSGLQDSMLTHGRLLAPSPQPFRDWCGPFSCGCISPHPVQLAFLLIRVQPEPGTAAAHSRPGRPDLLPRRPGMHPPRSAPRHMPMPARVPARLPRRQPPRPCAAAPAPSAIASAVLLWHVTRTEVRSAQAGQIQLMHLRHKGLRCADMRLPPSTADQAHSLSADTLANASICCAWCSFPQERHHCCQHLKPSGSVTVACSSPDKRTLAQSHVIEIP